jgi:hypothetical protein
MVAMKLVDFATNRRRQAECRARDDILSLLSDDELVKVAPLGGEGEYLGLGRHGASSCRLEAQNAAACCPGVRGARDVGQIRGIGVERAKPG